MDPLGFLRPQRPSSQPPRLAAKANGRRAALALASAPALALAVPGRGVGAPRIDALATGTVAKRTSRPCMFWRNPNGSIGNGSIGFFFLSRGARMRAPREKIL